MTSKTTQRTSKTTQKSAELSKNVKQTVCDIVLYMSIEELKYVYNNS